MLPASVCYSPQRGRYLVATTAMSPGTVVTQEVPVALVPMKQQRGGRCWCCLNPLGLAPFYCSGCPNVSEGFRSSNLGFRVTLNSY
jgi:hypothetical protein